MDCNNLGMNPFLFENFSDREALTKLKENIIHDHDEVFFDRHLIEEVEKNNPFATWLLGVSCAHNEPRDFEEAKELLERVITGVSEDQSGENLQFVRRRAIVSYSYLFIKDPKIDIDRGKVIALLKEAADQGDASAQHNLAVVYSKMEGMQTEAVRYYKLAAAQNHAGALYNLGNLYREGIIVSRDSKKAVHYYKLAAAQNHAGAFNNLGIMHRCGFGVTQNYETAFYYFAQAIIKGKYSALENLTHLLVSARDRELKLSLKPLRELALLRRLSLVLENPKVKGLYLEDKMQATLNEASEAIIERAYYIMNHKLIESQEAINQGEYYIKFIEEGFDCLETLWNGPEAFVHPETGITHPVYKDWIRWAVQDTELKDVSALLFGQMDEAIEEKLFKLGSYFLNSMISDSRESIKEISSKHSRLSRAFAKRKFTKKMGKVYGDYVTLANALWRQIPKDSPWQALIEIPKADNEHTYRPLKVRRNTQQAFSNIMEEMESEYAAFETARVELVC